MYERHWQLKTAPFRAQPAAEFFCCLPAYQSALLKLHYVLEQRQASAALIGPTGIGKSFLLRVLESELPVNIGPVISLSFPCLSPLELVRFLATELAVTAEQPALRAEGLDEWLHAWEQSLRSHRTANRLPVFVVDDAHLIEDRALWQAWQMLLAYRERAGCEFSVLFVGQPELLGRLQRWPQLEERLALVSTLTPLSHDETATYISRRLAVAGRTAPVFDDSALQSLWETSGGIPRRIDRLCDFSLLVGCADGLQLLTADHIAGVSQELRGRAAA